MGRWLFVLFAGLLLVTACVRQPETVEDGAQVVTETVVTQTVVTEGTTVEVTRVVVETIVTETADPPMPTPDEPPMLVICQRQEPTSLYWYGDRSLAATAVYHALYENSYTNLSFGYQAQALVKLPSLADGDAVLQGVAVSEGATVVGANGNVTTLQMGTAVINATGETVVFEGTPIAMNQLVVEFVMKPTVWADGEPVTADDSVYSFELASDPDTPGDKFLVARTAVYEATGALSTRWTGLPGFLDDTYFLNFRRPLPRHAWGEFSATELLAAEMSNRLPLGDGPYQIVEWVAGNHMLLQRNPHYYRAAEGLPQMDTVMYRFIPENNQLVAQLLAGQCDIVTYEGIDVGQTPFFLEAEASGMLTPYFQIGTVWEHLDFSINPESRYGSTRPDWFEDVRVRQAVAMCLDREGMVAEVFYGRSQVMHSYLPEVHPLFADDVTRWPYDVAAANALLDEVYPDVDGDGVRESAILEQAFVVTLQTTSGNEMRQRVAQWVQRDLRDCGLEVEVLYLTPDDLFADGPDGPLFGRRFDLAAFGWPMGMMPTCDFYLAAQIPTPENGWSGENEVGWINEAFDAACLGAMQALPGTADYAALHQTAQRIFAEQLPVVPLFPRLKAAVTRPSVCNFRLDPTQPSELFNIYEIGVGNCD
ncbi:MAG: peptide ABC transporter substrate-binding protein [Ardenticatenaceae bacterium]|nr:peptide ABC transporter substrate-binding protein [Ardenticatenaceae bacterium]